MMNIRITSINTLYNDREVQGFRVHFDGQNDDRTISIHGSLPMTPEEHTGKSFPEIEGWVKNHLVQGLMEEK